MFIIHTWKTVFEKILKCHKENLLFISKCSFWIDIDLGLAHRECDRALERISW